MKNRPVMIASSIILLSQAILCAAPKPPKSVANRFNKNIQGNVSDEFNGGVNFKKWTYRKSDFNKVRRISAGKSFVSTKNGYLSVRAKKSSRSGGGLCTLNSAHFGFYVTRWRMVGNLNKDQRTVFHPAIWSHKHNNGVTSKVVKTDSNWIEFDMCEFESTKRGSWSGDIPVKINNTASIVKKTGLPVCVKKNTRFDLRPWKIIGMEYMPTYCRMWELKNGRWNFIGQKVRVLPDAQIKTKNKTTPTSFPRSCADRAYWILSNIWIEYGNENAATGDTWLHVDYFAHYPKK